MTPERPEPPTIRRLPRERIDELRPLWFELLAHHGGLAGGHPPVVGEEESWRRRRAQYALWLADPDAFVLAARRDGELIGYAFVEMRQPDETWEMGERYAELASLAVTSSARGEGLGGALLDAVEEELRALGITDLRLGVVAGNHAAERFYGRRGMRPAVMILHKRIEP